MFFPEEETWGCRRSNEETCMFHSGSSNFLQLPSALINGDTVGICKEEKKAQSEKKRQRIESSYFQTHAELRVTRMLKN